MGDKECEVCGRSIRSGWKYCYEHRGTRPRPSHEWVKSPYALLIPCAIICWIFFLVLWIISPSSFRFVANYFPFIAILLFVLLFVWVLFRKTSIFNYSLGILIACAGLALLWLTKAFFFGLIIWMIGLYMIGITWRKKKLVGHRHT